MLLSKKNRFIFIHIYKTAGMSIKNALMPFSVNRFHFFTWRFFKHLKMHQYLFRNAYPPHITSSDLIEKMGKDTFDSFFSFAFVRNPWDWQVSLYKYTLKSADHPQHLLVKNLSSFEEYIRWRCARQVRFQKDFICSKDGKLLIDFVGKFERIDEDFKEICSRIGVSTSLPRLNVSNITPYRDFYSDETKDLVWKAYHPDITFFEYDF